MRIQHLRIARATENLDLVVPFYAQLLDPIRIYR
jgi:hypothetical protein